MSICNIPGHVLAAIALLANTAFANPTDPGKSTDLRVSHVWSGTATSANAEVLRRTAAEGRVLIKPALSGDGSSDTRPGTAAAEKTEQSVASRSALPPLWIDGVMTELAFDDDDDGYFRAFSLSLLPTVDWGHLHVFADIYISFEGGAWEHFATTEDFLVRDAHEPTEYVLGSILDLGYPRGYYDLLIEFYEAGSGYRLASVGPYDYPALWQLPLEDRQRDTPSVVVLETQGGGGATDPWSLAAVAMLAGFAGLRRLATR